MKYLKILGFAIVAAMSLAALVGADSASATAACTTTDIPPCTMRYGVPTVVDLSLKAGSSMRLTSGGATIASCSGGTIKGKIIFGGGEGEAVSANTEEVTWTGCSQTTHTISNGSVAIHWIPGTHNGTVTGSSWELTLTIFGVTCNFGWGTGTDLGIVTGGESPLFAVSAILPKTGGGFLCPSTAGWDAEYVVTEPHALFITSG